MSRSNAKIVTTSERPSRPRAVSANYRASDDAVAITLATGVELTIPRRLLQGLGSATPAELAHQMSEIEVPLLFEVC